MEFRAQHHEDRINITRILTHLLFDHLTVLYSFKEIINRKPLLAYNDNKTQKCIKLHRMKWT